MKLLTTEQFNKLSRGKRAVLIAKDVIAQIEAGRYKTSRGSYDTVFIKGRISKSMAEKDAASILRDPKSKIRCVGCARASLFISAVKFKNEISVGDVYNAEFSYNSNYGSSGARYLSKDFSEKQQSIIESAYEGGNHGPANDKALSKAIAFGRIKRLLWDKSDKSISNDNYVLIQICKNIIKNKGTFKP